MSITKGLCGFVAVALLVSVSTASIRADTNPSPAPRDRPSTVVVSVPDGGFHWADAGVGATATLATTLLAVGLVLALRPDRRAGTLEGTPTTITRTSIAHTHEEEQ